MKYLKALLLKLFLFSSLIQINLHATNPTVSSDPFFVVSIPKSGTFLTIKLLNMLLEQKEKWIHNFFPGVCTFNFYDKYKVLDTVTTANVQKVMDNLYSTHIIPITHTNFSEPLIKFKDNNPHFHPLLVVRDLRDVIVSLAFFNESYYAKLMGGPATVEERIKFVLSRCDKDKGFVRYIEKAMLWKDDPHVFILRFEDLIGQKGGGDDEIQKATIVKLAHTLQVDLDEDKLSYLQDNLFGKDLTKKFSTFHSGQIGSWKHYFDEEITALFIEKMGIYQVLLGYTVD